MATVSGLTDPIPCLKKVKTVVDSPTKFKEISGLDKLADSPDNKNYGGNRRASSSSSGSPRKVTFANNNDDINNNADAIEGDAISKLNSSPNLKRWQWTDPVTKREFTGRLKDESAEEIQRHRSRLPIAGYQKQFVHAVNSHQVVVVVGETGSGKSTQMPQYLIESGILTPPPNWHCSEGGRIAVTQPRRVAAVSVAQRVAREVGCRMGEKVGYSIRFEDMTGSDTAIKYMTDGLLLMECLKDPEFNSYSCVILDEAHERTLHTDVLMGLLKKAMRLRPQLKVVITSATLDIKKFAEYFNAPMVKIPGTMFPVSVEYSIPLLTSTRQKHVSLTTKADKPEVYLEEIVTKILKIHTQESKDTFGDILVFLPGKEEVEQTCALLSQFNLDEDFVALPIYAAMPFAAQCEILQRPIPSIPSNDNSKVKVIRRKRRIIVATNIAETSITIDGILFVIDSGLFKESVYNHDIETLKVTSISRAQADQRSGRAGRTAPGYCYRMYAPSDYERMKVAQSPAIQRIDFTSTALQLKVMGIDDICGFDFMDPPQPARVDYAFSRLRDLGALNKNLAVTDLGFKIAEFPLSPNLAKVLLEAADMGCSDEVLTIVSMLSVNNYIFVRPKSRRREADLKKMRFNDYKGDHLTLLNVFEAWKIVPNEKVEEWSKQNFINQKEMERAADIRKQLASIMHLHNVPVISCEGSRRQLANIRRALSLGLPNNVAVRDRSAAELGSYRTLVDRNQVFIHPSSALFKRNPELVIYHETITTTRTFMRIVSVCEKNWTAGHNRSLKFRQFY